MSETHTENMITECLESCFGYPWQGLRQVPLQEPGALRALLGKGLHWAVGLGGGGRQEQVLLQDLLLGVYNSERKTVTPVFRYLDQMCRELSFNFDTVLSFPLSCRPN